MRMIETETFSVRTVGEIEEESLFVAPIQINSYILTLKLSALGKRESSDERKPFYVAKPKSLADIGKMHL